MEASVGRSSTLAKYAAEMETHSLFSLIEQRMPIDSWLHSAPLDFLSMRSEHGHTPLICAARCNNADAVTSLLKVAAHVDGTSSGHGGTALYFASHYGQVECLKLLLHEGAAVDLATLTGTTPVMAASRFGHAKCVQLLLSAGAAVDLTRADDGSSALIFASHGGYVDCARFLLDAGAAVDLASHGRGISPLYMASQEGHVECVQLLLDAGAAVDLARTDNGATPLYMACRKGHVECARLLLDAGAMVDLAATSVRETPLLVACRKGQVDCARLLSSYGARREVQEGELAGATAEEISTEEGHAALTQWLILSRGWLPLHHLEVLSPERTRALLRGGADLHFKPRAGDAPSPLERAQQLTPSNTAASLVVRAAGPWSVASHELFPDAQRAQAVSLAYSLSLVYVRRMEHLSGWEAVDFVRAILPLLLCR